MTKIIYIGNNLSEKTHNKNTLNFVSQLFQNKGFTVVKASNKNNKVLRLLHMLYTILVNAKTAKVVLIDTFSTQNFYYAYLCAQLCRLLKIKYIPILHGGNLPSRLKASKKLAKQLFSNAYINVSPSIYLKETFEAEGFKVKYIPNSIIITNYPFKERKQVAIRLLWVRAFDKIYNPQLMVKVVEELLKITDNINVCMVGPEKDRSLASLKKCIYKQNLESYFHLPGKLTLQEWVSLSEAYDVFINTTTIDNMPVSIIEAMALGFPIISTNVGGMPYLITHQENGILVENNNAKAIANEVVSLINNPTLVQKLSNNSRAYAAQFDLNNVENLWLNLINNVV